MSEYYAHVRPKMSDFDVQVRVDVISTKVIVGTQINVDDLSKERHFLRFRNAVTIKTNLAYAMIRCANIKRGDLVVDVSARVSVPPFFQILPWHLNDFIDISSPFAAVAPSY